MLKLVRLNHTWLAFACLGCLFVARARADEVLKTTPAPDGAPSVHLTDAQDRLGTGKLDPAAEAKSTANALYAEALRDDITRPEETTLALLRQVASLDPGFADVQVKIATLLLQSGQVDAALTLLRNADHAIPRSAAIETMLGYALHLHGDDEEARRMSHAALVLDPTQPTAMRVLLEISANQSDLVTEVHQIGKILKNSTPPVPASAWLTLAQTYLEVAHGLPQSPLAITALKTSLPIYEQAAAVPPPDPDILVLLADNYNNLGRKAEALKVFQQASALNPSDLSLILHCANLESDLGHDNQALQDYEKAYAINPALDGLREMLGRAYLKKERYADAVRVLKEALADSPHNPEIGIALGFAYAGDHQTAQAQNSFLQVFTENAYPLDSYLKLAGFQLSREEYQEAGTTLALAQKQFPQSAKVRLYQALQNRGLKNYPTAIACLDQARTMAQGVEASILDANFYLESADILQEAGQPQRMEDTLREGLAKFPQSSDIMNELAYFWADAGTHLPQALALSTRALELDPTNGAIQDTRGWVYFQMGNAKDALPYLQRAAFLTNNDPVVLQHVGDAYLKLGRRSEAIAAWRQALGKDPANHDLTRRIDAALAQANNAQPRSASHP